MIFIGIDPGASGAIASITSGVPSIVKLEGMTERDVADMLIASSGPDTFCLIEKVHAWPSVVRDKNGGCPACGLKMLRGANAQWSFAQNYGMLRGIICAVSALTQMRWEDVTPQAWQKLMGASSDKAANREKAQALFPDLKVAKYAADALLISEYCRRTTARSE